jgi:2-methylisocitrate lyase-like PEP mutase family enzyme
MHAGPRPLLIANAWDAASAVAFELAGASAIGTTSLGIANSLGYSDGESHLPPQEMIAALRRLTRVVSVPVSADIEGGYGDVDSIVTAVIEAGAVGINLEDHVGEEPAILPLESAMQAIRQAHDAGARAEVPIVINARTDALLYGEPIAAAIERGIAYAAAGADCVFVVGVQEPAAIAELASSIPVPVNVVLRSGGLSVSELAALGVRRVSMGRLAFDAVLSYAGRLAREMIDSGIPASLPDPLALPDFNGLFQASERAERERVEASRVSAAHTEANLG